MGAEGMTNRQFLMILAGIAVFLIVLGGGIWLALDWAIG